METSLGCFQVDIQFEDKRQTRRVEFGRTAGEGAKVSSKVEAVFPAGDLPPPSGHEARLLPQ